MKSRDIVIVGILLGIGAIVRYFSLAIGGPITSNLVIAFYSLAILLIAPTLLEAVGIGLVAGIICMMISHSIFPPANMISEPIGAIATVLTMIGVSKLIGTKKKKDNTAGLVLTAVGLIGMLAFAIVVSAVLLLDPKNAFGITILTNNSAKLAFGAIAVIVTLIGLYFIPETLGKYKAAIIALIATLASGISFLLVAAFVIFQATSYINSVYLSEHGGKVPAIDAFLLASLPIVIGCAIINMVIAQVLYGPAKKAMR